MNFIRNIRTATGKLSLRQDSDSEEERREFVCSLTGEPTTSAVQDADGYIYDAAAIKEYLKANNVSPATGRPMQENRLQPLSESILVSVEKLPSSTKGSNLEDYLIQVKAPSTSKRNPSHICCVIDVSGSMNSEAVVQTENGTGESGGLSVLDVVKHSVRSIVATMGPEDKVSIVSYHDVALLECPPTACDDAGKQTILSALDALVPLNSTNLWGGLKLGMDTVLDYASANDVPCFSSVFLLTDGMPNVVPPRGHIPALKQYMETRADGKLPFSICTFGFGYNLDTDLLYAVASEGAGTFSFIPDAGMVGTVFSHAEAQTLTTFAQGGTIYLDLLNGAEIDTSSAILKAYPSEDTRTGVELSVGSVRFGQTRSFLVSIEKSASSSSGPFLEVKMSYRTVHGFKMSHQAMLGTPINPDLEERTALVFARYATLECILGVLDSFSRSTSLSAGKVLSNAEEEVAKLVRSTEGNKKINDHIKAIFEDITGQISVAAEKETHMKKWGKHYLPSLFLAHGQEFCNNFKDPGIQPYGKSKMFAKLLGEAETAFTSLPPPKPSRAVSTFSSRFRGGGGGPIPVAQPVDMSSLYYNRSNPCFAGFCMVSMADGSLKRVDCVKKGDLVKSDRAASKGAVVVCVVETLINQGGPIQMVHFPDGLVVTPYHPVSRQEMWSFPRDIAEPVPTALSSIFSFVLDDGHTIQVNGIECVTLGHNFTESVVAHPYFGSPCVLKDLASFYGWERGHVQLMNGCMIRDLSKDLVVGIDPAYVVAKDSESPNVPRYSLGELCAVP